MLRVASALVLVSSVCLAAVALVPGPDFLTDNLALGVPVGNAIALAGLVSIGLLATMISDGLLLVVSRVALAMAIAWYPLSIAIAGNTRLNFQGDGGRLWLLLTVATFGLLLASFLLGACQQLYQWFGRRG